MAGDARLPVGVIGCGRMGRLHARVFSQMPQVKLVGVFDASAPAAEAAAKDYGCESCTALADLLPRVKAVAIATPTTTHLSVAEQCLSRKVACLIEKPLARNSTEAGRIVALAQEYSTLVQVGHIERFNPAIRAIASLGIEPKFIEVTRVSPMTFRSIDVGVVLDMMIHDIDIVLKLANSPVAKIEAVGVSALGEVEDICNARITFANGCVANVTASRLALKIERKLRVFSPMGYVSLDYQNRQVTVVKSSDIVSAIRDAVDQIKSAAGAAPTSLNYKDLVKVEQLPTDDVEPLRAELDAFVESVITGKSPAVSAEEGRAAVALAEKIVAAMQANSFMPR